MKRSLALITLAALTVSYAWAGPINVTIADPLGSTGFDGGPTGVGLEDNETEVGTISNQSWDLEAFTFDPVTRQLNLISGFDMRSGTGSGTSTAYAMGDIFIRLGARVFSDYDNSTHQMVGDASAEWANVYVIHFLRTPGTLVNGAEVFGPLDVASDGSLQYMVFHGVDSAASLALTGWPPPGAAYPGMYHVYVGSWGGQPAVGTYVDNATEAQLAAAGAGVNSPLSGSPHDILSVNLGFLESGTYYLHATMDCGNDVIHGKIEVPVPDGGMTLVLLGLSLFGVAAYRRRRI